MLYTNNELFLHASFMRRFKTVLRSICNSLTRSRLLIYRFCSIFTTISSIFSVIGRADQSESKFLEWKRLIQRCTTVLILHHIRKHHNLSYIFPFSVIKFQQLFCLFSYCVRCNMFNLRIISNPTHPHGSIRWEWYLWHVNEV